MRLVFTLIFLVLLAGCSAYVPPSPTVTATSTEPTATKQPTVKVEGNVYVRDSNDEVQGWLEAGTEVQATCTGDWCYITGGQFDGLKFWRGCSEDNPAGAGCTQAR